MMLYYLFTLLSCILFLKSLPLKPLPPWASEMRLLPLLFWEDLHFISISIWIRETISNAFLKLKSMTTTTTSSKVVELEEEEDLGVSLLDLPDLALECILEKLPPAELCNMAMVCTSLRESCTSDHLWDRHMKHRWGRLMGPAASREWQSHVAHLKEPSNLELTKEQSDFGLVRLLSSLWRFRSSSSSSSQEDDSFCCCSNKGLAPLDSTMSWYLALEDGDFWFPAQVFNRENGHVGFMLSCYDAELRYDSHTDSFQARYPPHGRTRAIAIENGVSWERIRAPPTDSSAHDLHPTDCLNELRPGDHVEIQWRRNKGFPYGWWYGVVGHLNSCDGNPNYCLCHDSDTIVLEFSQYTPGSRWRSTNINRRDHRVEGDEERGFYGGIRKLTNDDEISKWKRFRPATGVLDMS